VHNREPIVGGGVGVFLVEFVKDVPSYPFLPLGVVLGEDCLLVELEGRMRGRMLVDKRERVTELMAGCALDSPFRRVWGKVEIHSRGSGTPQESCIAHGREAPDRLIRDSNVGTLSIMICNEFKADSRAFSPFMCDILDHLLNVDVVVLMWELVQEAHGYLILPPDPVHIRAKTSVVTGRPAAEAIVWEPSNQEMTFFKFEVQTKLKIIRIIRHFAVKRLAKKC